jgi:hypothetical protein
MAVLRCLKLHRHCQTFEHKDRIWSGSHLPAVMSFWINPAIITDDQDDHGLQGGWHRIHTPHCRSAMGFFVDSVCNFGQEAC